MSKNMTRKGLAFGAGLSLVVSGFAALPAQAGIETDLIKLVPSSGPEQALAITAGVGQTFAFTASPASTITSGAAIKTLVTDSSKQFLPTTNSTGVTDVGNIADNAPVVLDATANTIRITDNTLEDLMIAAGTEVVWLGAALNVDDGEATPGNDTVVASANTLLRVDVGADDTHILLYSDLDITPAMITALTGTDTATNGALVDGAITGFNGFAGRLSSTGFVVNSKLTAVGSQPVIELSQLDATTRSVQLQTWVDVFSAAAHEIDANEYKSKPVTAQFIVAADISWSTSLDAPQVGQSAITATITSTPMINGLQDGNSGANLVRAVITRQDSRTLGFTAASTQDVLTGEWPVTITTALATTVTSFDPATGAQVAAAAWADLAKAATGGTLATTAVTLASKVVTVTTTAAAHNLRVGETVTIAGATPSTLNGDVVVTSVPAANKFTYALDAADATVTGTVTYRLKSYGIVDAALVDYVIPGDYSAQAAIETGSATSLWALKGTASRLGTLAVTAADVILSTTASATLQGASVRDDVDSVDALIKAGTLSATVTATVVDKDGAAVGAGRSVTVTGITASHSTIRVNARATAGQVLTTDANGQVVLTVTDTTGENLRSVRIQVKAENVATATSEIKLQWATASTIMADLNSSEASLVDNSDRYIAANSSYTMNLFVADQWYTPVADADFRLKVEGQGVTPGFVSLVGGKAAVKVTDVGVSTAYATQITLQRKNTAGVWADTTTEYTINNKVDAKPGLTLAANGSTLYSPSSPVVAAKLSSAVAKVALVERDTRTAFVAKPDYANFAVVNGKVANASSNVSLQGSIVTVSGPSNILFENGNVAKRGSISLLAGSGGLFEVNLYSTTAQTDTVITVTANGVSSTVKVTFTGIGVGEGTALTVTAPDAVKPASTFQVKAKLADVYGNGVDTAAGRVKVTYTGPGIVFGTLPTETDANGELMFSVLLGSNDTGNVVVKVSYDQNGDADFVDAKDLNTTKTVVISASGSTVTGKVNVGSFNGKLVVYASGLNGATISWKVGGTWGKQVATSNYAVFNRSTPRAGVTVSVDIFVNGVKTLTKSVVTR